MDINKFLYNSKEYKDILELLGKKPTMVDLQVLSMVAQAMYSQQQEIERLKGEVERSRCCGNCKHENRYTDECIPCVRNENPMTDGDNWTAKAPEVG